MSEERPERFLNLYADLFVLFLLSHIETPIFESALVLKIRYLHIENPPE
jgi:hypothetical protein